MTLQKMDDAMATVLLLLFLLDHRRNNRLTISIFCRRSFSLSSPTTAENLAIIFIFFVDVFLIIYLN